MCIRMRSGRVSNNSVDDGETSLSNLHVSESLSPLRNDLSN